MSVLSLLIKFFLSLCLLNISAAALAESAEKINERVEGALETFASESPTGYEVLQDAAGVLVFPDIVKMGFGVGGEYGEGALLINQEPVAYYSTASASIGWQIGVQFKAYMIAFMTDESLEHFRSSRGWEAGIDASIAFPKAGLGGKLDTETLQQPVLGFVFSNRGLMYNLTLEGSKFTKLVR